MSFDFNRHCLPTQGCFTRDQGQAGKKERKKEKKKKNLLWLRISGGEQAKEITFKGIGHMT
jgi:hypothetical protein